MTEHPNPPAFPCEELCNTSSDPFATPRPVRHPGMSLLDYYAGQALANPAICTGTAPDWQLKQWFGDRGGVMPWEIAAKQARAYAAHLLAERNRSNQP